MNKECAAIFRKPALARARLPCRLHSKIRRMDMVDTAECEFGKLEVHGLENQTVASLVV